MHSFRRSLEAEILKGRNSFAFWLAWIGTTCILLAFFLILWASPEKGMSAAGNPWKHLVDFYYAGTDFMLLPLFVIIIASLVTHLEHRGNMWKHLYVLGVSRWHLYTSKLVFIILLFACAHAYFITGMLLSGVVLGILQPSRGLLSHLPDMGQVFSLAFKTILSVLGLLAIQYWISMRFKSFIVPLGTGVIGFVMATILIESEPVVQWIPYAYPLLYTQVYRGQYAVAHWGILSEIELYSLLYFALFTVSGYWHTRQMDVR